MVLQASPDSRFQGFRPRDHGWAAAGPLCRACPAPQPLRALPPGPWSDADHRCGRHNCRFPASPPDAGGSRSQFTSTRGRRAAPLAWARPTHGPEREAWPDPNGGPGGGWNRRHRLGRSDEGVPAPVPVQCQDQRVERCAHLRHARPGGKPAPPAPGRCLPEWRNAGHRPPGAGESGHCPPRRPNRAKRARAGCLARSPMVAAGGATRTGRGARCLRRPRQSGVRWGHRGIATAASAGSGA